MKRSVTGVKPTGHPHLGNLLGAIEPAIKLQDSYESFYFIADYHTLSSNIDPAELRKNTYECAASFLAMGIDPNKAAFFKQSSLAQHAELSWILSSVSAIGDLFRAHAYKAAKDKNKEGALNLATFSYPVLMAADILLYNADVVPVGKDQLQHLEMARAVARRFNHIYGECLKEPKELLKENLSVVPGIDGRKMSKSYNNGIEPLKGSKSLRKQVMSIVSDSKGIEDKKDPDTCHIFALYEIFANESEKSEMRKNYLEGGYGYGHAKQALFSKIEEEFEDKREVYQKSLENKKQLDEILDAGSKRASKIANETIAKVKETCGLL